MERSQQSTNWQTRSNAETYSFVLIAPAYDLNPNIERSHHQLAIDSTDPTPDIGLALATAKFYGLNSAKARETLQRVQASVGQWKTVATKYRLSRGETELVAQAFS